MDLIVPMAITFFSFATLLTATIISFTGRRRLMRRFTNEWVIDVASLLQQGLLLPVVQTLVLSKIWLWLWPNLHASLKLPSWLVFLISFVAVDYLYYWNHRLLHHAKLWQWHSFHHSARAMDILVTSRNSFFTSFLIVYVWVNSVLVFVLGDASWFLIAASLGAGFDLFRHSGFVVRETSLFYRWCSPWLTMPQDHSWHHSADVEQVNFSANLILWDRLHGTIYRPNEVPSRWGANDIHLTIRNFILPKIEGQNDVGG